MNHENELVNGWMDGVEEVMQFNIHFFEKGVFCTKDLFFVFLLLPRLNSGGFVPRHLRVLLNIIL